MMHGREKSDSAIVAEKPTNKVVSATAEPVEPRAGAKGNASQQSTLRTQCRKCVSQALERIRQVRRHSPKVGAVCGNPARTDLGGGRSVMTVPTALPAISSHMARCAGSLTWNCLYSQREPARGKVWGSRTGSQNVFRCNRPAHAGHCARSRFGSVAVFQPLFWADSLLPSKI